MYSDEEKSTSIAYRCINENLPKFLDNCRSFEKVRDGLDSKALKEYSRRIYKLYGVNPEDMFTVDYFGFVLSQSGIDRYNQVIGGYTDGDNKKIQGLNELINLHNPRSAKTDRLPKLRMLYKQILSDRETVSFIPESFGSDNEVLGAINKEYCALLDIIEEAKRIFNNISSYDISGIYVKAEYVSDVSSKVTGSWSAVSDSWNKIYDNKNLNPSKPPKDFEKYFEKRKNAYSANKSFSISEIQRLI